MKENIILSLSLLKNQVISLFSLLLFASGVVSFILGQKIDGTIIFVILFVNILLGFWQEFKASKASQKLLGLIDSKVYVFRGGKLEQISVKDLVLGDVVHFVPGSVLPLDVDVIEAENASVDDSMRTGETMPKEVKIGDRILAGSCVSSGKFVGIAVALDNESSLSKYRTKLESVKKWSSFRIFTNKVIEYVFIGSLSVLILAMVLLVLVMGKYDYVSFFIFSIAMLVGVVPEILPLIMTVILSRESLSLAKEKVIVKRLSALESLGGARFLLTDKTGTITENKLKVFAVNDISNFWQYSNAISESSYEKSPMSETFDNALNSSIAKLRTSRLKISHFEPFSHELGYETFVTENGFKIARGVANKILDLCLENKKDIFLENVSQYEKKGMRVLALAYSLAGEWVFAGYVAFYDPIKIGAIASFKEAHHKGIAVKILTGDSKEVATAVAEELHLIKSDESIVSLEERKVKDLSNRELLNAVVFAKCTPEDKLELIDRYLELGPVAFLGDGINDALALKRADIGIAVDNASDIAKESADILLLEKDLSPILGSVSKGRNALRNILIYIIYTLSGNAGTFFSLLVASFFYPVLPMLPIQILLNNLLTDLPLMLIITDHSDKYALSHIPHFEPKKILKRVLVFGLISSFFDLLYFSLYSKGSVAEFQTGWFVLSIFAELALILSIRSSRSMFKAPPMSVPLALGIIVSALLPFFFIYNDYLAEVFKFTEISFESLILILFIVCMYITSNEIAKWLMKKKNLYNKPLPLLHFFHKV